MILTEIGDVGITAGDRHYMLRPSLYAMTQIGDPVEIVRVYSSVMSDAPHAAQFSDALGVIYGCAQDDLSDLFGLFEATEAGRRYVPGSAPVDHVIPLARCLMKHGVTGALAPLPRRADADPEYVQEFDARAHVALAMAHLGMAEKEAWSMTMTSLVGALRAKFPPNPNDSPGARAPSIEESEATLEWHDRVLAARAKKKD